MLPKVLTLSPGSPEFRVAQDTAPQPLLSVRRGRPRGSTMAGELPQLPVPRRPERASERPARLPGSAKAMGGYIPSLQTCRAPGQAGSGRQDCRGPRRCRGVQWLGLEMSRHGFKPGPLPHRHMHMNVHSSAFCNSQEVGTPAKRCIDKQNTAPPYCGIGLGREEC